MKKQFNIRLSEETESQLDFLKSQYPDKTKTKIIEESIKYNYLNEKRYQNECKG